MHPALSVIVFTVLSGAGFGLVSLACLAELFAVRPVLTPGERLTAGALGLALVTLGLLSSTLHLANPKNAWRAFFRFRTSWLSREGVSSVLFYPCALTWLGALWWLQSAGWLVYSAAALTLVLAVATIFCTGMIYASLRPIPQWHSALVPVNYLLLAFASGALLLTSVVAASREAVDPAVAVLTLVLLLIAATGKAIYYYWIGKPRGPSINTAIGMTRAQVRLLESGQSSRTFLDKEFRHTINADRIRRLRFAASALGFLLPIALVGLLLSERAPMALALLAVVIAFIGLGIERWLFFAEARHVVNLFYGQPRC